MWQIANQPRWAARCHEDPVDDGEGSTGALSFWIRTETDNTRPVVRKLGMKTDWRDFTYRMFPWNKPVERIVFDGDNGEEFEESPESVLDGSIEIFVRGRSIVARSHRKEAATIRIVNVAGIVLNDFVIESGQTVETPVKIPGVYMANQKKLFVK
jgi:hypothetical protein